MRSMRFDVRLIFVYSVIILCILAVLSTVALSYARQMVLRNAYIGHTQTAAGMRDRLDYLFREMRSSVSRVQERKEIVAQMNMLAHEGAGGANRLSGELWIKRMLQEIIGVENGVYRLSVLNDKGDFMSNIAFGNDPITPDAVRSCPWYEELTKRKADECLTFPQLDNWTDGGRMNVFSLTVPLRYYDDIVGFIEVQCLLSVFSQLSIDSNYEKYPLRMIVSGDGRVLYTSRAYSYAGSYFASHYQKKHDILMDSIQHAVNPVTQKDEMIISLNAKDGWNVIVAQEIDQIMQTVAPFQYTLVVATVAMLCVSIVFCVLMARWMTKPLRALKQTIDSTGVGTLDKPLERPNLLRREDEFGQIEKSFYEMRLRLKQSMDNEIRLTYLQTKAHFDTLQARINPHYLYNTLGVISSMCYEAGQDSIAEMCITLCNILRYSISGIEALATVRDEMRHAQDYLALMKKRYEYRLTYVFDVDPAIEDGLMPKLCIQPLIENSILHGYENIVVDIMRIEIRGKLLENGFWEVSIRDNGCGFSVKALQTIQKTIDEYKRRIRKVEDSPELSIGGMGIVNTFVRIELFSERKVRMTLSNAGDGGAIITIRCPLIGKAGQAQSSALLFNSKEV